MTRKPSKRPRGRPRKRPGPGRPPDSDLVRWHKACRKCEETLMRLHGVGQAVTLAWRLKMLEYHRIRYLAVLQAYPGPDPE